MIYQAILAMHFFFKKKKETKIPEQKKNKSKMMSECEEAKKKWNTKRNKIMLLILSIRIISSNIMSW